MVWKSVFVNRIKGSYPGDFKSVIVILVLLVGSVFSSVHAATNEGYGEDQEALGQFVDTFDTSGNVSYVDDVIRNTTLEVMELNYTTFPTIDLSAWDETDPQNEITVNASTIEWSTQERRYDGFVQEDFGANYFDDFVLHFTFELKDLEAGDATSNFQFFVFLISNSFGTFNGIWASTTIAIYGQQDGANDDKWEPRMIARKGGATIATDTGNPIEDVGKWFVIFNRTGTDIDALFFTDEARTTLDFKLEITAYNDNLRYAGTAQTRFSAVDGTDHSSGYIQDLSENVFGSGYKADGWFNTTNYLEDVNANGSALVAMVITDIPANTDIQLQFSNDTLVWTDHEGVPGDSVDLDGGLESVDLRLLNHSNAISYRFNLSTTDNSITPRVNQSRLITMIGAGGITVNQTINLLNGTWIDYNLTVIGVTTGTLDSGNLASTQFIDGNMYNVSEVAGVPGMMISANITGVNASAISVWINIYYLYDGNLNHDFDIEVWNFTSGAWIEDSHLVDGIAMGWVNSTIYGLRVPNDFIESGEVRIRLDHESAGNINHDLFIDYFRVQAFVPTGLAVAAPGGGVGSGAIGFIILGLISIPVMVFLAVKKR
jgi:hypothetical protein